MKCLKNNPWSKQPPIGAPNPHIAWNLCVVLLHLAGEIFKAIMAFLVNFSRFSLIILEALVNFHQMSANLSQV